MADSKQQQDFEKQLSDFIQKVVEQNPNAATDLSRALIHRGVHVGARGGGQAFCRLSTYLAEMIQHSHAVAHPTKQTPGAGQPVH
jgi:hypothetical protein